LGPFFDFLGVLETGLKVDVFLRDTLDASRAMGEIFLRVGVDGWTRRTAKGEDNRRGKRPQSDNTRLLTHKGSADI